MRVIEDSEKAGFKFNIQKTKIMVSGPFTSWQINGGKMETKADFVLFSWALKSLWPVTAVMKLEDVCSLEEKLWQTYLLFSCSIMSDSAPPWIIAHQTPLSFTVSRSLLKLMSIESMMPFNHLILCCPSPPALTLSQYHSLFQWVSSSAQSILIICPKYWSFIISPSNEYLRLISFRIDWFDLLASKGLSSVFFGTTVQKIDSWALNLLYGPTLTSMYDYWKNHSFD